VASGGREKTANLLADFASLEALIPFNDETLLGAVDALRAAGRLGEVKMVRETGRPPRSSWSGPACTTGPGTSTRSESGTPSPTWPSGRHAASRSTASAWPARSAA
jgi:hypothetical protein